MYIHAPAAEVVSGASLQPASVRCWRNTVGGLIEICWLKKPSTGLNSLVYP